MIKSSELVDRAGEAAMESYKKFEIDLVDAGYSCSTAGSHAFYFAGFTAGVDFGFEVAKARLAEELQIKDLNEWLDNEWIN